IVVGEWMPISVFTNNSGRFVLNESPGFDKSNGWWYSIEKGDIDNDGRPDLYLSRLLRPNLLFRNGCLQLQPQFG
ncbi:MAG: VCBS repeat-containing protein, partial [Flavobacteriaceae bacterium]|nr:VCBS repeat-containing protein [Flavobacteriaceae bacterium]